MSLSLCIPINHNTDSLQWHPSGSLICRSSFEYKSTLISSLVVLHYPDGRGTPPACTASLQSCPSRTCRQIHSELVKHFYKDQTLVVDIYEIHESCWALSKTRARGSSIAFSIRKETRSYFKSLEIRLLTCKDPNICRKGPHWAAHETADWETMFEYTLKAFPNLETALVSFELEENLLRYWTGWVNSLVLVAQWLVLNIPRKIDLRWNFQPTSNSDLQALALEEREN